MAYGDRLGDYLINGFAGTGATSYVYQARRQDSFDPVAIKVLHPVLLRDEVKRARFLREAQVMMRLSHPNIVRFYEIIDEPGCLAFVMEYIEGQTLSRWCESNAGVLEEEVLACVFVDILRGLSHAHRHGIVHRDLKPANVLITRADDRYVAKIIDFGVARMMDEPIPSEEQHKILGTAAYISPEEVLNPAAICPASDLYSLGVMLYEAATGRRPFEDMGVEDLLDAHVRRAPTRPTAHNPEMSPAFESVILRTLTKSPDERFQSAPEMIRALELALQGALAMDPARWEEVVTDESMTTEWHREVIAGVGAVRGAAVWVMLMRCIQLALLLFAATGVRGGGDDPHYLSRAVGPELPLR
jgi:serine/threonine-protein kinase